MGAGDRPVPPGLRRAGRIAALVRREAVSRMVVGARLVDLCTFVEREIQAHGGEPAFPAQISCNSVAAHDCPPPEDERVLAPGDIAKLDLGVHVDGHVVDTAETCVLDGPQAESRLSLAAAARAGLEAVLALLRPGVPVRELARAAEETIRSAGFRPIRGLSGHGVGRWKVHCPPPIPNLVDETDPNAHLQAGMVVALEVFATTGWGRVDPRGNAEVFSTSTASSWTSGDPDLDGILRSFRGLPFARRQLGELDRGRVERGLAVLRRNGALRGYPPLVESSDGQVSQAEHTVALVESGCANLTVLDRTEAIL